MGLIGFVRLSINFYVGLCGCRLDTSIVIVKPPFILLERGQWRLPLLIFISFSVYNLSISWGLLPNDRSLLLMLADNHVLGWSSVLDSFLHAGVFLNFTGRLLHWCVSLLGHEGRVTFKFRILLSLLVNLLNLFGDFVVLW